MIEDSEIHFVNNIKIISRFVIFEDHVIRIIIFADKHIVSTRIIKIIIIDQSIEAF
jgi:hypothetical protein